MRNRAYGAGILSGERFKTIASAANTITMAMVLVFTIVSSDYRNSYAERNYLRVATQKRVQPISQGLNKYGSRISSIGNTIV
jgi:hypothetical protein